MSIKNFSINGLASGNTKLVNIAQTDLETNMLTFLQENDFPIASSCIGRGACHRCAVNRDTLLCQYTVKEFIETFGNRIEISYL